MSFRVLFRWDEAGMGSSPFLFSEPVSLDSSIWVTLMFLKLGISRDLLYIRRGFGRRKRIMAEMKTKTAISQ